MGLEQEIERRILRLLSFLVVFFLFIGCLVGCDAKTPSVPTAQASPTPTSTPIPTASPLVVTTPAPQGHDWWFRADGSFCVTNHSGNVTRFEACARRVYPGGDQDFVQTDAIVPGGWIPDGDSFCGQLPLFGCYTEMEIVEQPNTCNNFKQITGARYLNEGQYCQRPSPSPKPSPTPTPCVGSGTFSEQGITSSSATIAAAATVSGAGAWQLSLYAASVLFEYQNNQPDYVKDIDVGTTICGTTKALRVSYGWQGHDSRYWWADLKLNGQRVWKSQAVEH